MEVMVRSIKSDLVQRYAKLIGETSKVGGETSQVIHRTAKDMDDFLKINQERRRQLTSQVTTIYIAFAVLLIVLYQLISMFPSLGTIDISLLSATNPEAAGTGGNVASQMSFLTMKRRFFHLVIINSLGTGLIIGEFIEGKIKFGLIHSVIMVLASVLFFGILIL
jgi:archaellum biogenesis protein FlaJ (TadC family)